MVLGRLERTGPIVWGLPSSANLTIRQLGLLLFLAATGLASGQAFASQAFTGLGLRIVITGVIVVVITDLMMAVVARLFGVSPVRAAGLLSGFISQPAILAYGNSKVDDERLGAGFTALFAARHDRQGTAGADHRRLVSRWVDPRDAGRIPGARGGGHPIPVRPLAQALASATRMSSSSMRVVRSGSDPVAATSAAMSRSLLLVCWLAATRSWNPWWAVSR